MARCRLPSVARTRLAKQLKKKQQKKCRDGISGSDGHFVFGFFTGDFVEEGVERRLVRSVDLGQKNHKSQTEELTCVHLHPSLFFGFFFLLSVADNVGELVQQGAQDAFVRQEGVFVAGWPQAHADALATIDVEPQSAHGRKACLKTSLFFSLSFMSFVLFCFFSFFILF